MIENSTIERHDIVGTFEDYISRLRNTYAVADRVHDFVSGQQASEGFARQGNSREEAIDIIIKEHVDEVQRIIDMITNSTGDRI